MFQSVLQMCSYSDLELHHHVSLLDKCDVFPVIEFEQTSALKKAILSEVDVKSGHIELRSEIMLI